MFKSQLGRFSDIMCPNIDSCIVPNCLFKHTIVLKLPKSEQATVHEPPEKKRKVDLDDGKDSEVDHFHAQLQDAQKVTPSRLTARQVNKMVYQNNVKTLRFQMERRIEKSANESSKEISPPPVRRKKDSSTGSADSPAAKPSLNPRPVSGGTAPHQTRHLMLKAIHAEMTKLNKEAKSQVDEEGNEYVLSDAELILYALDQEEKILKENSAIYKNKMAMRLTGYKKMKAGEWIEEQKRVRNAARLENQESGKKETQLNVANLSASETRQVLRRLVADQGPLAEHGYVTSPPSEADINKALKAVELSHGWEQCERCNSHFQVFPSRRSEDGALTTGGECQYHPGRPQTIKGKGNYQTASEKRYSCCGRPVGESNTCSTAKSHVFKIQEAKRQASVMQFERTPENSGAAADRAVCFDCEMGYTTLGLELIRVTAMDWPNSKPLLDVLVKPLGTVLDLNTQFSGITVEQFTNAVTYDETASLDVMAEIKDATGQMRQVQSPYVARSLFFKLITPRTPLIGHAIENDLNALRIVHPTIIDTVVLWPHKGGLPFRKSLKQLASDFLKRKIQAGHGHDSREDAIATGDLVRLKVDQEWEKMEKAGWLFVDGELWPPTEGGSESKPVHSGGKKRKQPETYSPEHE